MFIADSKPHPADRFGGVQGQKKPVVQPCKPYPAVLQNEVVNRNPVHISVIITFQQLNRLVLCLCLQPEVYF